MLLTGRWNLIQGTKGIGYHDVIFKLIFIRQEIANQVKRRRKAFQPEWSALNL